MRLFGSGHHRKGARARSALTIEEMTAPALQLKSPRGRWVVAATVLGSSLAMLDGTVVNVALPRIGEDLGAEVAGLQWVLSGYTLTLAS